MIFEINSPEVVDFGQISKKLFLGSWICVGARFMKLRQMQSELEDYEEFGADILRSDSTTQYYETVEYELNRTNGYGDT